MKLRTVLFAALLSLLLAACNWSLAEDITPPPDYTAPTPVPAQGFDLPAQAPDVEKGAATYAEKCAACHGDTGLGDGPQGAQLPVSVPPLALPEVAWQAAPADWFETVTLGNINNYMPPFTSLNDQERWNVAAYAQSLSITPELVSKGEELFNKNCADCPTVIFTNQEMMAALSMNELISLLAAGGEGLPALGESLSEDELGAVAAYLRTLTIPASMAMPEPAAAAQTESVPTEAPSTETPGTEAPPVEETPAEGEQVEATPEAAVEVAGFGPVSGKLVNGSGGDVPSGLTVTLLGFDHALEAGGTPTEVINIAVETDDTGAYLFEEIEIFEDRIFLVEVEYQGIAFQSELAFSEAGSTELVIPDLMLYESTTESGGLVVEQLHISFDMAGESGVQVFELYTISNLSDKAYIFNTDGSTLPFMPLPEGAVNVGLELSQDSAPLIPTENGFAIPPSDDFYSIIAFFNLPYDKKLELSQPLALPVSSMLVIVPEGIEVKAEELTDEGIQQTQQGFNVRMYSGAGLSADTKLDLELSGEIKAASATLDTTDNRQTLLIGAGAFGVILILAGVWMFLRDRDKLDNDFDDEGQDDEAEFESTEEIMDAIIALDDLHRGKKISDEAYQKRRAELKELLKELA